MLTIAAGGIAASFPRYIHRKLITFLRPAEAAVRRLIIIAAHGLTAKPTKAQPKPSRAINSGGATTPSAPAFRLIEPLKNFAKSTFVPIQCPPPRISVPGLIDPIFHAPSPASSRFDLVSATSINRRLAALKSALENLPYQAKRLARWRANRDRLIQAKRPCRYCPTRPGLPPGFRNRHTQEVHIILKECHGLVMDLWADSS
jgi:hypothetical protein